MSDTTIDFSTDAILQRMRDGLENPANKLEGGFCMDNLQAVAEEMARMDAMEVQPIPDQVLLDTAEGEYLDRKALDYNETPPQRRWAICSLPGKQARPSRWAPRFYMVHWPLKLQLQRRSAPRDNARWGLNARRREPWATRASAPSQPCAQLFPA